MSRRRNKRKNAPEIQPTDRGPRQVALGGAAAAVAAAPLAVNAPALPSVEVAEPLGTPPPMAAVHDADTGEIVVPARMEMAALSSVPDDLRDDCFTPIELDFFRRAEELYAQSFDAWEDLEPSKAS